MKRTAQAGAADCATGRGCRCHRRRGGAGVHVSLGDGKTRLQAQRKRAKGAMVRRSPLRGIMQAPLTSSQRSFGRRMVATTLGLCRLTKAASVNFVFSPSSSTVAPAVCIFRKER